MICVVRHLALWFWRLRGWKFEGNKPAEKRYIIIAVPHTSNWDFILFLAAAAAFDIPLRYIGKHTLFKWPFGGLMRRWGGIPVDRSAAGGMVGQVAEAIKASEEAALVITPEGTRGESEFWKSGFYRIAQAADVPVLLARDDWATKVVELGPWIHPSGNVKADMDRIRSFYAGVVGRHPERQGPMRMKEEG